MSDHDNWKDNFGQALANAILSVVDDKTMSPDWFDSRNVDAVRDELLRTMPALTMPALTMPALTMPALTMPALTMPAGWSLARRDDGGIDMVAPKQGPAPLALFQSGGSHAEDLLFALADAILKEQGK